MYFPHIQLALRAALVLKITFVFWAIKRRAIYVLTTTIYIFPNQDTSIHVMLLTPLYYWMWRVSLSFTIAELRSEGTCGGLTVHSPAPGMICFRGSGLCPVCFWDSPQMGFVQPPQGLPAVLSHSHGEDFFLVHSQNCLVFFPCAPLESLLLSSL